MNHLKMIFLNLIGVFFLLLINTNTIDAQTVDVRFNNSIVDCSNDIPQLCMDIQIKSSTGSGNLSIGNANFFASYNDNALEYSSYSESGFNTGGYPTNHNNFTASGIVTIAWAYQGSEADAIVINETNWSSIGNICFDIEDATLDADFLLDPFSNAGFQDGANNALPYTNNYPEGQSFSPILQCAFDVRFNNATVDCISNVSQLCLDIEVKANTGMLTVGNANFFAQYNDDALEYSSYTELGFTGNGYQTNHNNFSGFGFISIAWAYEGTLADAIVLDATNWSSVGNICFDIEDASLNPDFLLDPFGEQVLMLDGANDISYVDNYPEGVNFSPSLACPCGQTSNLTTEIVYEPNFEVTLSWEEVADAEAYQLAGRKVGGQAKIFPETPNTTRTFTGGILYDTSYEWSVRVKCDGNWTDWVLPLAGFTTASAPVGKNNKDSYDIFEEVAHFTTALYPNPTSTTAILELNDIINFTDKYTISTISIVDVTGKVVDVFKTTNSHVILDVSQYTEGYYIIEVNNGGNTSFEKMIIAR